MSLLSKMNDTHVLKLSSSTFSLLCFLVYERMGVLPTITLLLAIKLPTHFDASAVQPYLIHPEAILSLVVCLDGAGKHAHS